MFTIVYTNHGQTAFDLDQNLELKRHANGYYVNWGGLNEKWMLGNFGSWFFILPDGRFFKWGGSADLSTSFLIATLDFSFYDDTRRVYEAPPP